MKKENQDRWIKCISTQGNIRGVAIQATHLTQAIAELHGARGIYAQGMGESLIGALLIASYCKSGQRANLNVQGSGYFKQALVDAYPEGHVRGYIIERQESEIQKGADAQEGPWGTGFMSVLRTRDDDAPGRPYIGTVPLVTGHMAKDLTFYWAQSEQIPSAVGIAVNLKGDRVVSAGGFLVQALPGASSAEVKLIEQHINEIQSLADRIAQNADPMNILSQIFQSTGFMLIEEKKLEFRCNCSWERVERALTLVGVAELRDMLIRDQFAIVRCDFCTKEYKVDADNLQRLIDLNPKSTG